MWIFRRHRHLKVELLSQYLDGRLAAAARSRVSRQVDFCELCRDELDSLRSTVALLQALPELTAPRSYTLAAPPLPRPVIVRQPVPLRAPGWAYAGAASLAGLALAIMVSADALGLLTPTRQDAFSIQSSDQSSDQSSERSPQPLQFAVAPDAGSSAAMATSQPQIASGEARDTAPPEPAAAPEADSIPSPRTVDGLPEPTESAATESAAAMAQPGAGLQPETMASADGSMPGPDGATELPDSAIEGNGFSEKTANPPEDVANLPMDGPPEGDPDSDAVLRPDQYQGTPIIWRVLEGIATALLLFLLGILVIKRLMSRRVGG